MEEWQSEWIVTNGPRLYNLTEVTSRLLDKLCSKRIFDQGDVDELMRIGKHEKDGVTVQKSELYSKLTKRDSYDYLIEILLDCKLTGAANLLIEGREANKNKLENVGQRQSPEMGVSKAEICLFGKVTTELNYYIPRSIQSRCILSKQVIFQEDTKDIFLFTGIKAHDLSSYLGQRSSDKSGSQLTQSWLSVKHVLLETKEHFQRICDLEKEKPVHWLHHEGGRFAWVKSGNGNMSTIQKATRNMKKESEIFSESDFLAHLDTREIKCGNCPVVIADTPGMGKSELLQSFAREIAKRNKRAVILVVISELINLVKKKSRSSQLSSKHFEEALILLTTTTKSIEVQNYVSNMKTILQPASQDGVTLELMLDGFDEINSKDLSLAHQIFALVRSSYPSTRIWVATRPHFLHELENELNVIGFRILPFQKSDREQFLTSFWHSKICKNVDFELLQTESNKCSQVDINLLTKFAKHCLTTLTSTCSKSSKERAICGVPLECLMLAEVFQHDCLNFVNRENWTSEEEPTLSLKITSIKDLYESLINVKLDKFGARYYSKELRPTRRVQLLNQHVYLAIQLLFLADADNLVETLLQIKRTNSSPSALLEKDIEEILNVGIVEDSGGADSLARNLKFIHRTIAEFLVARFIVEQLCPEKENESSMWNKLFRMTKGIFTKTRPSIQSNQNQQHLQALLRDDVFKTENQDLNMNPSLYDDETFLRDVLVFFIDSLLEGRDIEECTRLLDLVPSSSKGFILAACIENDIFNIFRILMSDNEREVPSTHGLRAVDILEAGVTNVSLTFLKVLFAKFGQLLEEEGSGAEALIQEKAELLECSVRDREYSIVDYLLNAQGFSQLFTDFVPPIRCLLHKLVGKSRWDSDWLISEKLETLTRLAQLQPKLLGKPDDDENIPPPFLQRGVHIELSLKLIELGADPLARSYDNSTLLHFCEDVSGKEYHRLVTTLSEKPQVLQKLVKEKTRKYGKSVLNQIARFIKKPEKLSLECLLSHGADFTVTERSGMNCLHIAANYGNIGAARALLEFEVVRQIVNERTKKGKTPLDVLMTCNRKRLNVEEFGRLLMEHGARLGRDSILHEVLSMGELHLDRALFLLDVCKVEVNGLDDQGNTPLHTCFLDLDWDMEKRVVFARALLEKGADVKALNGEKLTPFQVLIQEASETDESSLNVISLLDEYGAVNDSPEMAQICE